MAQYSDEQLLSIISQIRNGQFYIFVPQERAIKICENVRKKEAPFNPYYNKNTPRISTLLFNCQPK